LRRATDSKEFLPAILKSG